jgi:uncharacterized protein YegP (UPF0339 family)
MEARTVDSVPPQQESVMHKFTIVSAKSGPMVRFVYNSEVMVWSEAYSSKSGADNCIESIKKNAAGATIVDLTKGEEGKGYRFELVSSKDGQVFTRFVASNGETMVRSETYASMAGAKNCAESVQKRAADAPIELDI